MQEGNSGLRASRALRERYRHLVFVNWFSGINLIFELFRYLRRTISSHPKYEEVTFFKYAIGFLLKGAS